MTHDELLEAVARAVFNADHVNAPKSRVDWLLDGRETVPATYHRHARAALAAVHAAIRAPSAAQLAAGQKAWLADPHRKSSTLYRAMIDASARKLRPA